MLKQGEKSKVETMRDCKMHRSNRLLVLLTEGAIPIGLSCNVAITKVSRINFEKRLKLLLHYINLKCIKNVALGSIWLIPWSILNKSAVKNRPWTKLFHFQSKCKGFRTSGTTPMSMASPRRQRKITGTVTLRAHDVGSSVTSLIHDEKWRVDN